MKRSEKIAFKSIAIGAIAPACAFLYWGNSMSEWIYIGIWVLAFGALYDGFIKLEAAEAIIDRDKK